MSLTPLGFKILAVLLLFIPMGILSLLTVGEISSGELSGLQHVIEVIPLLFLAFLSWRVPDLGGKTMFSIALALGILYLFFPPVGFSSQYRVINALLLFGPVVLAGILFISSSRKTIHL